MRNPEKRHSHDRIVRLKIGNDYLWPIFSIDTKSIVEEQNRILYFFGKVLHIEDFRTVRRSLLGAEEYLSKTGNPVEITQYKAFKFFEDATNKLFSAFRKLPGNFELDSLIETNTDHGFTHQRRLERHLKEFFKKEPEYRRNPNLLFFTLSQLISIRFHDILELFSNGKESHTEGGALLALGYLDQNRETFNRILEEMGMDKPDDSTWSKIMISTFATCLYHSKPKLLEVVQKKIEGKEKVNIDDILSEKLITKDTLEKLQEKHKSKPNFISFINEGFNFLKKNKYQTVFSQKEAKDLIESVKIFAAIDKLDSVLPAELSTARTFITMKDSPRLFFIPLEKIVFDEKGKIKNSVLELVNSHPICQRAINRLSKNKPLDYLDEYYLRIALAEGSTSPDDFSRLLFETQRVDFSDKLPKWLKAGFKFALIEKGEFLLKMVPDFLTTKSIGFFEPIYLQAETDLLKEFLIKNGLREEDINTNIGYYSSLDSQEDRDEFLTVTINMLNEMGIQVPDISINFKALRQELSQLEETLIRKKAQFMETGLIGENEAKRTEALLRIAINKRHLPQIDIGKFSASYRSYYPISPRK